jgi:hypothetical protein
MTELDYQAVKEVIRLLPEYSKTLDFDIITTAYQNVIDRERKCYAHSKAPHRQRAAHGTDEAH